MRAKLDAFEQARSEPIAVVGIGCRLPGGVHDPEGFWRLLQGGVDAITEVPPDRWDIGAYYDSDPEATGRMSTRYGGFLERVDRFDAGFFGISPREAASMDPQQRLLLEVAWEALEHAGVAPAGLAGSLTGVFVGISSADYAQLQLQHGDPGQLDIYAATGAAHSVASGRLSYLLGLQGPAVSVDTACSSSLAAVHQACQSLRLGECTLALAGGVNVILLPENGIAFSRARMLAPDGRCKTFDARADGYVRAEGCGILVLRRLSDAVAAGDRILALIRGSAINQDGRSSGLTAPNGPAQEAVIREALARAGVAPADVDYVEAHGTGTALGDPIEVQALAAVLGQGRPADRPFAIGSVKTNIGHLEAAAGVAGLIKVVLALQHGEIPPHLHLRERNPHIAWDRIPVVVPTARTPWARGGGLRIAGVSSFGFSGTNAHVVLEEAPAPGPADPPEPERTSHLLVLSAKSERALTTLAERMRDRLADTGTALADVGFTASIGRSHFSHRVAIVGASAAEAVTKLAACAAGQTAPGVIRGREPVLEPPRVAFLFPGQGAQYAGMGRELYATEPAFRRALDRCAELLRPHMERPLLEVLFPPDGAATPLDETAYAQPALVAVEWALAELWRSWGVEPTAVLGYSVGEFAAACVAGVLPLEDGLRLVAERARLIQALPRGGAMAAVLADEATVAGALAPANGALAIAAVNGPGHTVIAGREEALQAALLALHGQGIGTQPLPVTHAFHSPLMDPILDVLTARAGEVRYAPSRLEVISTVTGQLARDELGTAAYWGRHLRVPVRFAAAMRALHARGYRLFVEIGPTPTLVSLGKRCLPAQAAVWVPSLWRGRGESKQMQTSLATLYVEGAAIDWAGYERGHARRRVALPTYPWQREVHFLDELRPRPGLDDAGWAAAIAAGRRQAQQVPLDLALHTYPAKWQHLDQLATACIAAALRGLGAFAVAGETRTVDGLVEALGILPVYRALLARWLRTLTEAGWLEQRGERFVSRRPLPADAAAIAPAPPDGGLDDVQFLLEYVQRGGEALGPILTGAASPLETLFPAGSFAVAEQMYERWSVARYGNAIVRALVEAFVQGMPARRPLRVLEIGAGTGGTTESALAVLPPARTVYDFTDVSDLFLGRAEGKFAAYPFVRYGRLDIENGPTAQGYAAHGFDVVLAANAIHATCDLRQALRHVRELLAPGGLLVLYETTRHPRWFDVTIGLIEGWQRFAADDLRREHPVLAAEQWQTLLRAAGFTDVAAFPEAAWVADLTFQHVLIARAPRTLGEDAAGVAIEAPSAEPGRPAAARARAAQPPSRTPGGELAQRVASAAPHDRWDLLVAATRAEVGRVLRLDPANPPDRRQRLIDLGLDSLMAVELRDRLGVALGLDRALPATLVFDHPTVDAIAAFLAQEVLGWPAAGSNGVANRPAETGGPGTEVPDRLRRAEEIAQLGEDEVEAMLMKKLKGRA